MPNRKRSVSQTRAANRRTHDKVEGVQLTTCSNCGAMIQTHRVCPECGYYRGKEAIKKEAEA